MDKETLLELITTEDVIQLLTAFGSSYPLQDSNHHLLFDTCVCHGGNSKGKLCFYPDTKTFYCYTGAHAKSLYDLIMYHHQCEFRQAFEWLCEWKGISVHQHPVLGFKTTTSVNEDFLFLDEHLQTYEPKAIQLQTYDDHVLSLFHPLYSSEWADEGITSETAEHFDLRFCFTRNATIIPYRNKQGELIGIRQRNHDQEEALKRKYIPTTIAQTIYRYPSSQVLYGLYEHQEAISRYKEAVLFEGEKSVLLHHSYYKEHSTALAIGGSHLSHQHRQLLLEAGVETVTICMDKQYQLEHYQQEGTAARREYVAHIKKLKKMVSTLTNYFNVQLVMCYDNRLDYKDSPVDQGRETFEALMQERVMIYQAEELDELLN